MPRLGVNIDHIANIRQARKAAEPDPIAAAVIAELAGAEGITVHLRQDRRHIQDRDVRLLRQVVHTSLNLEMAATGEMISIALEIKPDTVTLVPEHPDEVTTQGGLDVASQEQGIAEAIVALKGAGIKVSLFIDPDPVQVKASHRAGADCIEIHTGIFAAAVDEGDRIREWERIRDAAKLAAKLKMRVHAGHDLTYRNVGKIVEIREIEELNIGHNIVARAALVGLERAVREMVELLR
ncbi:MAG: pyridoxine 5'-phosphate synthase [bacterium]